MKSSHLNVRREPNTAKFIGPALLGLILSIAAPILRAADSVERWFTLDKLGSGNTYGWREGRTDTLVREGPWVRFEQRWRGVKDGVVEKDAGIREQMAVNCLTGALGATRYERDPLPGEERIVTASLQEIEDGNSFVGAMIDRPKDQRLYKSLETFACDCESKRPAPQITDDQLRRLFDKHYLEQRTVREFHIRFIRVDDEALAREIVARLDKGESFSALADKYSTAADLHPGGDLGFHSENEWPDADRRILYALRKGEYTHSAQSKMFGLEITQLVDYRDKTPDFGTARPELVKFATRAAQCDWSLQ